MRKVLDCLMPHFMLVREKKISALPKVGRYSPTSALRATAGSYLTIKIISSCVSQVILASIYITSNQRVTSVTNTQNHQNPKSDGDIFVFWKLVDIIYKLWHLNYWLVKGHIITQDGVCHIQLRWLNTCGHNTKPLTFWKMNQEISLFYNVITQLYC